MSRKRIAAFAIGVILLAACKKNSSGVSPGGLSPTSGFWLWLSGSNTVGATGSYGTRGVAAATNVPGARHGSAGWVDTANSFWLFGGLGFATGTTAGEQNDLWKFDGTSWTWIAGANTVNQSGVYGTQGTAAAGNNPGGRYQACYGTDPSGHFWLFGGYGADSSGTLGGLGDLWKFDGTNWTWISGSKSAEQTGVYGTKGTPAPTNMPGARQACSAWVDTSGNFWLFGGYRLDVSSTHLPFNDLWKFDGTSWTWISGSDINAQPGVYGTQGVAASSNVPGARAQASAWRDAQNNLFVFGGTGVDSTTASGSLNDLWKFDGSKWTWLKGATTANQPGVYGSLRVSAATNTPGARYGASAWIDGTGKAWLFGGQTVGFLSLAIANDLWLFDGTNWEWVDGESSRSAPGIYGTLGTPATTSIPGSRSDAIGFLDAKGNLLLFGGSGLDSASNLSYLNDLWRFTP